MIYKQILPIKTMASAKQIRARKRFAKANKSCRKEKSRSARNKCVSRKLKK